MAIDQHTIEQDTNGSLTSEGGPLDFTNFMEASGQDIKNYVAANKELLILTLAEKAFKMVVKVIHSAISLIALLAIILFLNTALALFVGDLLNSTALGFVIVAGFYLLLYGVYALWWKNSGHDKLFLNVINDLTDGKDV